MAEYLLEAQHLRKAFEDKTVLQDVSLGGSGDRSQRVWQIHSAALPERA